MSTTAIVPPYGVSVVISNKHRGKTYDSLLQFDASSLGTFYNNIGHFQAIVKQVIFKNQIYNINTKNNHFKFQLNATIYEFYAPTGDYNADTLVDFLNSCFTTALPTVNAPSCSFDTQTQKIIIDCKDETLILISSEQYFSTNNYVYTNAQDRFLEVIGFIQQSNQPLFGVLEGIDHINLYGTSYITLDINQDAAVISTSRQQYQTIAVVPITSTFSTLQTYEPNISSCFKIDANNLQHIKFTVHDEWGEIVEVAPACLFLVHLLLVPENY